jgi:hypothetical protein
VKRKILNSAVKLAGELANVALKTIVVVYVAISTLEQAGLLVKQ